jgi:ubiquinone/menaquinone biosynthesis C-methylase UbiE
MGLYSKYVLPRFIDLAMGNRDTHRLRAESIPQARGEVLEIGIGSGRNLEFYTRDVQRVYGVDPSLELQKIARQRMGSLNVEFVMQSAERQLPLEKASIDTAVITWTLCSIPNPVEALWEVRRVLRPDAVLIFIEHGHSPDGRTAAWQERLTPLWKRIGGGCHLNRRIGDLIVQAGFQISDLKTFHLPGPKPMTFTYQGIARPA